MPAEWGLRWVLENQEVVCALSGMSTAEQVIMNCAAVSNAKPNSMPLRQLKIVERAVEWFKQRIMVSCTSCRYCMPCPKNVDIPSIFSEWNRMAMTGALENGPAVSAIYNKFKKTVMGLNYVLYVVSVNLYVRRKSRLQISLQKQKKLLRVNNFLFVQYFS